MQPEVGPRKRLFGNVSANRVCMEGEELPVARRHACMDDTFLIPILSNAPQSGDLPSGKNL